MDRNLDGHWRRIFCQAKALIERRSTGEGAEFLALMPGEGIELIPGSWAKVIQLGGPSEFSWIFFCFWMQQLLCVDKGQPKRNDSLLLLLLLCFWSQPFRPFCQDATEGALQKGQSIEMCNSVGCSSESLLHFSDLAKHILVHLDRS